MKKTLLSLAIACIGMTMSSNAQVIISESFESPTAGALPTGWIQASTGSPIAWETSSASGTTWASLTSAYNIPAHSQYVVVDDAAHKPQLHDTLISPVFSLVSMTAPWLNFECFYYGATNNSSGITEHAYVLGSTDGGATWTVIDSVANDAWDGKWVRQHVNLTSTLSGATCRIAFTYSDGGGSILGVALDNFEVKNTIYSEASILSMDYNSISNGISANGLPLTFTAVNEGITLTSLDVYYTIAGGAQVAQSFTGLSIAPYQSQTFTFTTPMSGAVAGSNIVRIGATQANGTANIHKDSVLTSSFILASATTERQGLIEEFTSSTCSPCKSFNANYDPLCVTLNANVPASNFNIIKYQMNWPNPGSDKSFNAHGDTRKTYYSCNSIPDHWVNGKSSIYPANPFSSADFTTEANNSHADKAFMDMAATYMIDTERKKVSVVLTVTPHFTQTGNYTVYTALCDNYYENTTNTTGQLKYYHVMRKMIPSAVGHAVTSWTDGVSQTFTDTGISYTNKNWSAGSLPIKNSYDFWSNPLLGSEMVAFVQEDASKSVMQSLLAMPVNALTVNVSTVSQVTGVTIYPNPAKDEATLSFNIGEAGNVHIKLADYTGRTITDVVNGKMNAGAQKVTIPTTDVAAGNYLILIEANGGLSAQRITVEK